MSHPRDGWSMRRYSVLLEGALRNSFEVLSIEPKSIPKSRIDKLSSTKLIKYFEKGPLLWIRIVRSLNKFETMVIADHSDAWILNFVQKPSVVVFHDMYAILSAQGLIEEHKTRLSGRVYQWMIFRGLKRANFFICVSEKTQSYTTQFFPQISTTVIHNPLDLYFSKIDSFESNFSKQFDNYALIIMGTSWRKNRLENLAIWHKCREKEPKLFKNLVIVGPPLTNEENLLLYGLGLEPFVFSIQNVDWKELPCLYANANLLINVTKYEGFGWPVIEANSMGTIALHGEPILQKYVYDSNNIVAESLEHIKELVFDREFDPIALRNRTLEDFSISEYTKKLEKIMFKFLETNTKKS
jgi:glycosyltransferase involved in cell wall biosynthesis